MATTTNFGWETPDDTDLVKDGAAAIRTVANSIDTSFVDLKGGTTGQILSKASNTDLDYTWITNDTGDITAVTAGTGITGGGSSGAVTITNDMATKIDAKGDLIAGTGADTYDRLAVGTNGQALLADSTTSTGLKWGSVASSKNFSLLNTGGTALTGAATVTYSGISGMDTLMIVLENVSAGAGPTILVRLNSDSGANYYNYGVEISPTNASTYSANIFKAQTYSALSGIRAISSPGDNAADIGTAGVIVQGCNSSGKKIFQTMGGGKLVSGTVNNYQSFFTGYWDSASTITSVSVFSDTGNLDAGTLYIYGSA